jgi:hypothetical protein
VQIRLFEVPDPSLKYSNSPGVKEIGEVLVATPSKGAARSLSLSLRFGGTESTAEARNANGEKIDCTLDLEGNRFKPRDEAIQDVITADICFMMDCTGSMAMWIEAAQQQLINIAKRVEVLRWFTSGVHFSNGISVQALLDRRPEYVQLRFAFVAYRDICDGSQRLDVFQFTSDRKAVTDFIGKQREMGGGDAPEDLLGSFASIVLSVVLMHIEQEGWMPPPS